MDLELFTPIMSPWARAIYTFAIVFGTFVAFHVQKAVLRTLGNLNKRYINIIIFPSLVSYEITYSKDIIH